MNNRTLSRQARLIFVGVIAVLMTACASMPSTPIHESSIFQSKRYHYTVDLPPYWVKLPVRQTQGALVISKDGYGLHNIQINAFKHDKAFAQTKQKADEKTLISDLAAYELAEFKTRVGNPASVKVLSNTLQTVSNQPAYQLHLQFLNAKGLRMERMITGFMQPDYYYKLIYAAPTLHYFERDKGVFEQMVSDFTLTSE